MCTVTGVEIPFLEEPVQWKEPNPYRLGVEEQEVVNAEVANKGVIEEVEPEQEQVISNVFLRPKKDGGHRMIVDLTWVNLHVQ